VATCYPNTSYTRNWAPNKASSHDLHPKRCKNPPRDPTLHLKIPGAPLVLLGRTWFLTTWHQAPSNTSDTQLSPSGTNPVARRHARAVATATIFGIYRSRQAAHLALPSAILVAQCYWFLATGPKGPQSHNTYKS